VFFRVWSPGSVAASPEGGGRVSLLVCNNYTHRVTRHVLDTRAGYRVKRDQVLLDGGLNVPDGVAISHDGQWVAISSHGTHEVQLFATRGLGRKSLPAAILRGPSYPHGLRFTADDCHLLVADAGNPVIHVYERGAGWKGNREPVRSVSVLDDATFALGRHNPTEGGPKGIDLDRTGSVVAVTSELRPLAFFALASIVTGDDRATAGSTRAPA
jgi:DNA-binding beta-propeller fold protein YncE